MRWAPRCSPHRKANATRAADPSKHLSRVFGQHLNDVGIVEPGKVFHSFRHTVITRRRTAATDHAPARVVGTDRVLTPMAARQAGGLYSDGEFDLQRLAPLRPRIAELGRSCTDPAFRTGGVILMLWAALADFRLRNGLDITVGCASMAMHDGGHTAASLWQQLRQTHLAPAEFAAFPRLPLPVHSLQNDLPVEPPALIKGYLKCGGKVLGPPAWDPDLCTADLPMMMKLADLPAAYRRRFIRAGGHRAAHRPGPVKPPVEFEREFAGRITPTGPPLGAPCEGQRPAPNGHD